jgi:phospholipid/cholesterol/gamma-HCH transport system permease protein
MSMRAQFEEQVVLDEAPRKEPSALAELGRDLFGLYELLVLASKKALAGNFERKALVEQAYSIGNGSMLFVTVTMMVVGMITVVQSGVQTQRVIPELSLLGANIIQILAREFAPTVCALMLATRVGAGIAAEIGSMVVTDQVDALRMSGADPIDYLVVPRLIASIVMTTALSFWALFVSLIAGTLAANMVFDLNYSTFINFSLVGTGDFIVMGLKSVSYGVAIPIVSARRGLTTFGGSEGVGWATTNAVVHSSLAIIIIDLILSVIGYVVFPPV